MGLLQSQLPCFSVAHQGQAAIAGLVVRFDSVMQTGVTSDSVSASTCTGQTKQSSFGEKLLLMSYVTMTEEGELFLQLKRLFTLNKSNE